MKTKTIIILVSTLMIISACTSNPMEIEDTMPNTQTTNPNSTIDSSKEKGSEILLELLPSESGYTWIYNGSYEYGHQMTIDSIETNPDTAQTIFNISGQVEDMSSGESMKDYHLNIKYIVSNASIIQQKSDEMMMDSLFNEIEIIKLPLDKNSKWEQTVHKEDGTTTVLNCKIEKIVIDEGKKVYSILYDDANSDYYEKRELMEQVGIISFEKLYIKDSEEPFVLSYRLYSTLLK